MKKILIITTAVVVVGFALYFVLGGKDNLSRLNLDRFPNLDRSPTESPDEEISGEEMSMPVEPDAVFQEPVTYSSLNQSYFHANFSFKYPDGFNVLRSDLNSGGLTSVDGEMVTVENDKGSGLQIFSITWDEPVPITPERIWQDQPDMEINDPKNADLDGSKAFVFNSYDGDLGETFEMWTIYKGKLYQITGPKTAQQLIIETLETWSWR